MVTSSSATSHASPLKPWRRHHHPGLRADRRPERPGRCARAFRRRREPLRAGGERRDHPPGPGHARAVRAGLSGRHGPHQRPLARRDRHREGGAGPGGSTGGPPLPVRERPFSGSTARRCRSRCWRASSSGTRRAPSRGRCRRDRACSRRPTEARCSWTRWASCPTPSRSSSCACSRSSRCSAWAAASRAASMFASSRPPTVISRPRSRAAPSGRTCISG
jgi:hypothetical protein